MVYSYHIRENDKSSFQRIKSLSMLLVMIYCETQNGLKLRISRVFVTDDVGLLNYQRIYLNTYKMYEKNCTNTDEVCIKTVGHFINWQITLFIFLPREIANESQMLTNDQNVQKMKK